MIANQIKGRGFRGTANYILEARHDPQIIGGNMAGETARELASEFRLSRELRPTLKRAVYHASLSVPIEEKLSDQKWREIGETYLRKMGFTDNQFVIVRHNDTQSTHDHVHILASRIRFDGSVVSESQDYRRSARIVQALEEEHSLTRAAKTPEQAWDMEHRPLKPESMKKVLDQMKQDPERVEIPPMMRIQEAILEAAKTGRMDRFIEKLEEQGIGIKGNIQSTGRVSGVSFIVDGVPIKGSDLGKSFAWKGLQEKLGVEYVEARDFERLSEASKRAVDHPGNYRDEAKGPTDDAGRASQSAIPNRSDTDTDRERVREMQHASGKQHQRLRGENELNTEGSGRERFESPSERGENRPRRGEDEGVRQEPRRSSEKERERGEPVQRSQNMGPSDNGSRNFESWTDRLSALGEQEESSPKQDSMGAARGRFNEAQREKGADREKGSDRVDLTAKAVKEQVKALGVERVEIGILRPDQGTGKPTMENRTMTAEQLIKALPMLKRENAIGANIYIRQASEDEKRSIVLIDDLKPGMIAAMKAEGWDPAAVVQTSPNNYQAWVKVPDISRAQASQLGRDLATRYQGDPASTDWRHYGRLAGFTNRKPEHIRDGLAPFVTLPEASGKAPKLAEKDRLTLMDYLDSQTSQKLSHRPDRGQNRVDSERGGVSYAEIAKGIMRNPPRKGNGEIDQSRVDFRVALDGYKKGLSKEEIRQILAESPNLVDRKNDPQDYIERTVSLAEMRTNRLEPKIEERNQDRSDRDDFFGHFGR